MDKVPTCKRGSFAYVDSSAFQHLVQALPFHKSMECFTLTEFRCDDESLVQLCKWMKDRLEGNASRPLTELVIQCPHKNAHLMRWWLLSALSGL